MGRVPKIPDLPTCPEGFWQYPPARYPKHICKYPARPARQKRIPARIPGGIFWQWNSRGIPQNFKIYSIKFAKNIPQFFCCPPNFLVVLTIAFLGAQSLVLIERQQLWVANCVFMILLNGENYPVPARKSKVKYPTRPGKNNQIPDPLDTRKFQKMKYPTRSIPGKSLPDPSLSHISLHYGR